jgi:hypothetical protein
MGDLVQGSRRDRWGPSPGPLSVRCGARPPHMQTISSVTCTLASHVPNCPCVCAAAVQQLVELRIVLAMLRGCWIPLPARMLRAMHSCRPHWQLSLRRARVSGVHPSRNACFSGAPATSLHQSTQGINCRSSPFSSTMAWARPTVQRWMSCTYSAVAHCLLMIQTVRDW